MLVYLESYTVTRKTWAGVNQNKGGTMKWIGMWILMVSLLGGT